MISKCSEKFYTAWLNKSSRNFQLQWVYRIQNEMINTRYIEYSANQCHHKTSSVIHLLPSDIITRDILCRPADRGGVWTGRHPHTKKSSTFRRCNNFTRSFVQSSLVLLTSSLLWHCWLGDRIFLQVKSPSYFRNLEMVWYGIGMVWYIRV